MTQEIKPWENQTEGICEGCHKVFPQSQLTTFVTKYDRYPFRAPTPAAWVHFCPSCLSKGEQKNITTIVNNHMEGF